MSSLFRRDCVCQRSVPTQVNTLGSYIVTPRLHTTNVVSSFFDLGSRSVRVSAEVRLRPGTWSGPAWGGRVLPRERATVPPPRSPVFSVANRFTLEKGLFFSFFFVKWRKAPHCPFHSPHSGVLFPHISYKKKYSFHKYVATCRLTPGAEQQAN